MRALVVGAGRMGAFHARILADLGYTVTTVDPNPARGADYRVVPHHRCYHAVCIAVPIASLAEQAAHFAGHLGHLLIEKPYAATHTQAVELTALLEGQRVAVGYTERFNPQVQTLHHYFTQGASGHFTRWNDRATQDVNLDLRSHDIDLAAWLKLDHATYDTRASMPIRRRHITITAGPGQGGTLHADLLDHTTSPLHAQWRHFLAGGADTCTPEQATLVLATLEAPVLEAVA